MGHFMDTEQLHENHSGLELTVNLLRSNNTYWLELWKRDGEENLTLLKRFESGSLSKYSGNDLLELIGKICTEELRTHSSAKIDMLSQVSITMSFGTMDMNAPSSS